MILCLLNRLRLLSAAVLEWVVMKIGRFLIRISNYFEKSAVGCTRPALDEDWAEDDGAMIGTSGKTVRPKLYIGAGISGAMHHVCGISDTELIVSINKDENADIFKVSDLKIVGDAVKILTALEERLAQE